MEWDKTKTNDVIGLGNPLMDFLVEIEDDKFLEFDVAKGEMHLIDEEKAKEILNKISHHDLKIQTIPGGSCANTLKGIAALGGSAILCGKVGDDAHGELYVQEIEEHGVKSRLTKHKKTTGHCVTFVTPDSERTFSVHLGAALHFEKLDVFDIDIIKSKILHLEGYQLEGECRETLLHAIKVAKNNKTLVSLDLADPGLIRRNKEFLLDLVKSSIDIVFVNEVEAKEFTGVEEKEALLELVKCSKFAIVKLGKQGSLISDGTSITNVSSYPAQAIDTTGAGDSYAAGFLYGLCHGFDLETSGKLGSLLAAKVVEMMGVRIKDIDSIAVKNELGL